MDRSLYLFIVYGLCAGIFLLLTFVTDPWYLLVSILFGISAVYHGIRYGKSKKK